MHQLIRLMLILGCFSSQLTALALTSQQVPEPLKPWLSWVLPTEPQVTCPFLFDDVTASYCQFLSQLELQLTAQGGAFALHSHVFNETWLTLVGDATHWPQQVKVDNQPALLMARAGLPALKLSAGVHQITGQFFWDSLPEQLTLPAQTALVALRVNNKVQPVQRTETALWLTRQASSQAGDKQNSLAVRVFRKIDDDVPLQVQTHLQLDVSGEPREVLLEHLLLPDTLALSVQSPLPSHIESDGSLRLQVSAGQWHIDLDARATRQLNELVLKDAVRASAGVVTDYELWAFAAHPQFRVVQPEGLVSIDSSQTDLPQAWQTLPAYRIQAGQALQFKVLQRGKQNLPNQLQMHRHVWLDFAGTGYSIEDDITGQIGRLSRLNALASLQLGSVRLNDKNQLITLENATHKQGIEVRAGAISLNAQSRSEGNIAQLSAVGWEQAFNQVNVTLHLPAGWQLLAASGVDNVPNSWLARWSLLDLFLVLVTTLAIGRLFGYYWGGVAAVTFALIWQEADAPQTIWLHCLTATALLRVLPTGRLGQVTLWYRHASWLVLAFLLIPFMVEQVRLGLYPHLATPWQTPELEQQAALLSSPASVRAIADSSTLRTYKQKLEQVVEGVEQSSLDTGHDSQTTALERLETPALIQTGQGVPQWQGQSVELVWQGVVSAEQQVRLWYVSPAMNLGLSLLRVFLLAGLAWRLFALATLSKWLMNNSTALPILLLIPVLLASSPKAFAEFPSEALLHELKTRLQETSPPDCLPSCAQIHTMHLSIDAQTLTIDLSIHAQERVLVPLPADSEQWFPSEVLVNQRRATGLLRRDKQLWLQLNAGQQQVVLRGAVPTLSQFSLPLPLKPHRVTTQLTGWESAGIHENGLSDEFVQLSRRANSQSLLTPSSLPAFVRIERRLILGLNWRVMTQISRLSPQGSAIVLSVPLLAGEAVATQGIRVVDKQVAINLAAQQTTFSWQSTLEKTAQIALSAANTSQWTEVWQVDVSPLWHLESSGIAPVESSSNPALLEWRPVAGERVDLQLTRPVASQGNTLTIDNSRLQLNQGLRSREVTLTATLRSSQGRQYSVLLPENALLQTVSLDGQALALALHGKELTVPLRPMKQILTVTWQEPIPMTALLTSSTVNLGQSSVNQNLHIRLGENRWVLWVAGMAHGPVILFWGELLVLILLALALGKINLTPLANWQWFLLLLGLSQVALIAASSVVAWLLLLGWRYKQTPQGYFFNLKQLGLVFLTLLALATLCSAVAQGLLDAPDMRIMGNQSSAFSLNWYADRSEAALNTVRVVSLPLMAYRLLMLAWSLWLAVSLLNWLQWAWQCFSQRGLWQSPQKTSE